MKNLISEQIPNDGGYHIKRLVNEANEKLSQLGRYGKRAKIVAKKSSLSLQFSFKDGNGRPQKNVGLGGIPVSPQGIVDAKRIASMVTNQLSANSFTWDWFNDLIGKDTSEQTKQLTCREMVEEYKKHYFKQRKSNKSADSSWYIECRNIESVLGNSNKPLSMSLVREVISKTENNSECRKSCLNGIVSFLKHFDNSDYKNLIKEYKGNNKIKRKSRNVPSDARIVEVYEKGFAPSLTAQKKWLYRFPQWQFLYGLLATYGLRVHEAWCIANWDKPVVLRGNDWVEVEESDKSGIKTQREGEDRIYPAILDPENKQHLLCIRHNTKTGYRVAFPLPPKGRDWIQEFNLLQPLNLPDISNPLERTSKGKGVYKCSGKTCDWFKNHDYGFKPHDLRHAYNHRGHRLGINPKALADGLGHSMAMNQSGYLRHMSHDIKTQGIIEAITKEQSNRSELDAAIQRIEALETQLLAKDKEIEVLQTKLKMYEAIEESKGQ